MKVYPVKSDALLADHAVITVAGKAWPACIIAAAAFAAVTPSCSGFPPSSRPHMKSSIGYTLGAAGCERAVARLQKRVQRRHEHGLIEESAPSPVAVIEGSGRACRTPGISARVCSALRRRRHVVAMRRVVGAATCIRRLVGRRARARQRVPTPFNSKIGGGRRRHAESTDVGCWIVAGSAARQADQIAARYGQGSIRSVGRLDVRIRVRR